MAYGVCHAPRELSVRYYLKFIPWKSLFSQIYNSFSSNLIPCCIYSIGFVAGKSASVLTKNKYYVLWLQSENFCFT